jgi:hypothetical protein
MQTQTTTTTETTTIETKTNELRTAIRKQARLVEANTELQIAYKQIFQVSISGFALRNAGLSEEQADSLLQSLREASNAIRNAYFSANEQVFDGQEQVLELAEGLSK